MPRVAPIAPQVPHVLAAVPAIPAQVPPVAPQVAGILLGRRAVAALHVVAQFAAVLPHAAAESSRLPRIRASR